MSWTSECTQSNEFKVKEIEEVKEVLNLLGFNTYEVAENTLVFYGDEGIYLDENAEVVHSLKPININGEVKNLFGVLSDNVMDSVDLDEIQEEYNMKLGVDIMVSNLIEYLQDMLLTNKDYILITSVGYTERCSGKSNPYGDIQLITKYSNNVVSLYNAGLKMLQEEGFKV